MLLILNAISKLCCCVAFILGEVIAARCIIVVIGMQKRALKAVHHSLHLVKSHCHVERQNIYNEKIINAAVCYLCVCVNRAVSLIICAVLWRKGARGENLHRTGGTLHIQHADWMSDRKRHSLQRFVNMRSLICRLEMLKLICCQVKFYKNECLMFENIFICMALIFQFLNPISYLLFF